MSAKSDFENMLKLGAKKKSIDPSELVLMGKRASKMYLDHNIPLTEAVIKVASESPGLSRDHVQRVIENANLLTFEDMFKVASDKNISFDLADPEEVWTGLNKEEEGISDLSAYWEPPKFPEVPGLFETEEKEASYSGVPVDVTLTRLYHQTKTGSEYLAGELSRIDSHAESTISKLASLTIQAGREGSSATEILELMAAASDNERVFEKISSLIGRELLERGIEVGVPTKGVPNMEHPIAYQYKLAEALVDRADKLKSASDELFTENARIQDMRIKLAK